MLLSAASSPSGGGGSPLWLSVIEAISGVVLILGIGGFAAIFKSIRRNAVRDDKLDELIHPESGVLKQLEGIRADMSDMKKFISPNGLRGDELGNIVKRTELAVNALSEKQDRDSKRLERHIGASETEHTSIRRELDRKVDR